MKRLILIIMTGCFLVEVAWAAPPPSIIPEMQECMQSHGTPAQYEAVLKKYSDPGIIRQAMGLLVIKKPYVLKAEQKGQAVCYTVEGRTEETSSEMPSDVVQAYNVCWERGRIVSLEFYGAKPGVYQEILPQMLECMRSHGSQAQYEAVLRKYCEPGMIRKAMGLLVIRAPAVIKTEKRDAMILYTVEGRTIETSSEFPADTVQRYRVGWKNGRIVAIDFLGPNPPVIMR